jgi:hypothetical protein
MFDFNNLKIGDTVYRVIEECRMFDDTPDKEFAEFDGKVWFRYTAKTWVGKIKELTVTGKTATNIEGDIGNSGDKYELLDRVYLVDDKCDYQYITIEDINEHGTVEYFTDRKEAEEKVSKINRMHDRNFSTLKEAEEHQKNGRLLKMNILKSLGD